MAAANASDDAHPAARREDPHEITESESLHQPPWGHRSASDIKPPTVRSDRTLEYQALSKTADVRGVDYGPDGGIRIHFQGKVLGKE
jgi:hypothetical protein